MNKRARGCAARSSTRHKRKQPNKKKDMKRRAERAFAAKPLGESPFSTLGGVIQIISFIAFAFPYQSLAVAAFLFSSSLAIFPLILS